MPGADPWAHRSTGMRCATCMWFVLKPGGELGRCRRRAPTLNGYPAVYPHDWCGDHKLDETKLRGGGEPAHIMQIDPPATWAPFQGLMARDEPRQQTKTTELGEELHRHLAKAGRDLVRKKLGKRRAPRRPRRRKSR